MSNTPKIDEILTILLVDYGNGDDNVGKAKSQIEALILEARIDELKHIDYRETWTEKEGIKTVGQRITELQEGKI